jgi:hypothetical protein
MSDNLEDNFEIEDIVDDDTFDDDELEVANTLLSLPPQQSDSELFAGLHQPLAELDQQLNVLRENTLRFIDNDILQIKSEDLQSLKKLNNILKKKEKGPIPEIPANIQKIKSIVSAILKFCLNTLNLDNFIDDILINDLICLYYIILEKNETVFPSELLIAFLISFCINNFNIRVYTGTILKNILTTFLRRGEDEIGPPTTQAPINSLPDDSYTPDKRRTSNFQEILDEVNELAISVMPYYAMPQEDSSTSEHSNFVQLYSEYLHRHSDDTASGGGGSTASGGGATFGGSKRKLKKSKKSKRKYNKLKKSNKSNKSNKSKKSNKRQK